ncbi:right-handed parallel beta-helix repeat-containing protein [Candidatus Poribacteria bacterium]|nr:right-handed parallel beta-helix repeat-containing protein [Candidatus Poribacteria bacterium]
MLYLILSLNIATASASVAFYVSPDGDDSWSGKLPVSDEDRTDGPFASLERTRDAIRELKTSQEGKLKQPVIVYLRGGIHFLTKPLALTPEDSGNEGCPVIYSSYPGEEAIISGGRRIEGWKEVSVNGKRLWAAEIPEVREGKWFFRQIWVNGQRRKRARHPNKGYLSVAEVPGVSPQTPWNEGQTRIRFHEGDIRAWRTIGNAELVLMTRWVESRLPIVEVDEAAKTVTFGKKTVFRPDPGDLYYVENALELLDEPGEWYLDPKDGALYYMPLPDERMDEVEVIAPVLAQLIRMEGEPEKGRFVENLIFKNLVFAHTEWPIPDDRSGFSQATVGVSGAIWGDGVRNCSFERCTLEHLGTYGIELARGCKYNRIEGCTVSDLGAGGIKIGETVIRDDELEQTHDNTVSNCHIYNGGLIFHSAIGIWIGQSYNNRISHNHIHDFYYSGFSVGWTWGYGRSLAGGNIIEHNHVHHIGVRSNGDGPILSDMGGIYTLGIQEGTIIRNNIFHDIAGLRYGGWGIYFDEGSTHIVAENNLVYRTTHGGFHQHYGRENVVRNNIFALARDHQIQRSRPEEHQSFTFERNIVYWRSGALIAGNLSNLHFTFDRNLYWCEEGGEIRIGSMSWDEWRERGMDVNSIVADPRFVDPERDDFRLRPDSPAFKLGFVPFDILDLR